MTSIQGLPTQGSDVTVLITRVNLHPLCVCVEFWGKFSQERTADYLRLAKDIQSPGNVFQEFEGNPCDQCLVQIDGTWYRSRIVSRNGLDYSVFLIDRGMTYSATVTKLAWGKKEHFQLPAEVEFCVLANVLPLSLKNRWSPVALQFLKTLTGKSVMAHVQDVLVPDRMFLLHIPCISTQMYEMGFARKLSPDVFQDFVLMSLMSHSGTELSPEIHQFSMGAGERLHKQELFMYPELPGGTVETVIVTEVTDPQRIFCQLKVFSQELKKLSEQLTQSCEGRMSNCIISPEMVGFPCATRGGDGRWHRSVLQQVLPTNKVVEVLNVDYGTKQFVQVENVRPLAAEFFRMPVVTYICSLHGIRDKGVGWTARQIDYLRSLLLYKTVIAKFEYQSISEGVHYVTLYGDENANMNILFGSKESCFLECEKTLGDYAIRSTASSPQHPAHRQRKMLTPGQAVDGKGWKTEAEKLPAEDLSLNSSHVAVVQHASNPAEFWIQTQNYTKEFDELMNRIYCLYKESVNKEAVRNPTVGLYCAAKSEDGNFYRTTVAEVGETQIKVFFVDYGNTEVLDRSNIRTLPSEFKKLPRLALKCTLAGVRPKDGSWSQRASEFFSKAVTDKVLNVRVVEKYDGGYVVQLTDPDAQGEQDVSTLMCTSGLAERAVMRQSKAKLQTSIMPPSQHSDTRLSGVSSGMSVQTQNTVALTSNERGVATFKEHMFPIGSVLDVSVSYIESPNDFWCQLVQNAGHLKLLMHDLQAHYAGSEFQPYVETACVARHPENGMWYRALIIHKHETPHVDVLYVDYGQTETVSLYDLRRICPEFLTLQGQAFRCCLLNPEHMSTVNQWNEEATARFHSFVETAASNLGILKCTVYAVMYSEQKIVFNIVDLETPFERICTSMVNLTKNIPPRKAARPSFRLDTYYYSTHNIKTGMEEQVTVTCVNTVSQFYFQLERNAKVMKDLRVKVSNLCHQLEKVKLPTVFGTLCFAKYTDGQWYRGQIKATKPTIQVHFVDYGDTIEVDRADLLPVPKEANDIMSVPVQAVVCGLSDVPAEVNSEVNSWFETTATECEFRAVVVARETDGKLLVELYHGNTQINAKIKKMFQIETHAEEQVVCQRWKAPEASANHAQKTTNAFRKQATDMEDQTQALKKNTFSVLKPPHQMRDEMKSTDKNLQKSVHHVCENAQKGRTAPRELYRPPHQRQPCGMMPSNDAEPAEPAGAHVKPRNESLLLDTKQLIKSPSPDTGSQKDRNAEKLPKLADLPSKSITSGMAADVYVSHCNSPLSFYVQLVREEDEIFSLAEKLNDPEITLKADDIKDVHPGDLVQAEFSGDSSWYRAVVREVQGNTTALVEFVDFGNTETTPMSKMGSLHKSFLQLPMYSTHCMLSDAAVLGHEAVLDPEVVSGFKEDIGVSGVKVLKCEFIRQMGSVWEVGLKDNDVNVVCKAPARCPDMTSEKQVKEEPAQICDVRQVPESTEKLLDPCSLRYHPQEFYEDQQLEVYIATTNDAQTFWCQSANSEDLDKITLSVSEVGDAAESRRVDPGILLPGSPCLALFSDDQLWYRAEVVDKDGDELSVLFVDYGNKSPVSITDVREIPPLLVERPPQAFLCELAGFDASCGSWDSGAADALSTLTVDKLLQLTVTKVTRADGNIKYLVLMECEGQVINVTMKTWWKCSTAEDKPDADGVTDEPPLQRDSAETEAALPEDQLEPPDIQEVAVTFIHPERDHSEEHSADELADPHTADKLSKLTNDPKNSERSDDSVYSECPKEESVSTERVNEDVLTWSFNMNEVETDRGIEEGNSSAVDTVGTDDLMSPLDENLVEAMDESEATTTDRDPLPGEVNTSIHSSDIMTSSAPGLTKERDDRGAAVARCSPLTCTTAVKMVPREALSPRESAVLHGTTETMFEVSEEEQIRTELVLPTPVLPVLPVQQLRDASTELEAGDDIAQEDVPCAPTQVEDDSVSEEEASAHDEETRSALLTDTDTAASEPHTSTVPSPETGDEVGEVTCCVDETCSTDAWRDPKEPSDNEEVATTSDDCLSSVTAEETAICTTVPQGDPEVKDDLTSAEESSEVQIESLETPSGNTVEIGGVAPQDEVPCPYIPKEHNLMTDDGTLTHHEDQLSASPSDTEPQTCTVPSLNVRNLVEEVTCLIGDICLTDICQGPKQEAETVTEESEKQVHTSPSPQPNEDFDDSALAEEISSSADDGFEAELSTITHLSLIIDDSADILPAKQQPEE